VTPEQIVFWIFAPIAVASAVLMIVQRNAVHSALFLILNFFCIAIFYLLLGSPFLFVVQIVVYAGAIMVLFLFVIMLLGVDRAESLRETIRFQRPIAILLGIGVAVEVITAIRLGLKLGDPATEQVWKAANAGGNPQALARVLFADYFLPFEITSVLLIVAAIAAMVLTRRRLKSVPVDSGEPEDADEEGVPV
jgi:NADH-quinone oxidoreductase subunit J